MKIIQRQRILDLLSSRSGQWISLKEIDDLKIMQYNSRIHDLRKEGYHIENRIETVHNDLYGGKVKHSFYRLLSAEPKEVTE